MRKPITALALLALPVLALASGYSVPNYNPRDLALADSAVAAQDGAAAVYRNPAALAGLEGVDLVLGGSLIDLRSDWTATAAQQAAGVSPTAASMYPKAVFPPGIYASYGGAIAGHRFGVGAGFNIPAGGNVYWRNDWPGSTDIISVNRKVYAGYLSGGFQLVPGLKLGAGVVYYRTTELLDRSVDFISTQGYGKLGTSGDAWSYDLSFEWTPLRDVPFTIGLDYKHKGDQKLTGNATFLNVPPALAGQAADQAVTHELTVPNYLNVGLAYRVVPQLLLTGQYSFERYVVYRTDTFQGNQGVTIEVPRSWGNGHLFRFGAEWTTPVQGLTARAGFLHDSGASDANHYSPTLPDASLWAVSVGAGYAFLPGWSVDAAFFRAMYDTVDATNSVSFPGVYKDSANVYSIGVSWHVPVGPKLAQDDGRTAANLFR
ncbi:OmpP1/FadL family transporter [Anaeromyxobacter paludicola]|uniref:Membrane protein n=1 Tax=Anaeromyxobacter paludicola TaxID=2918171 RepID=A0ABM7XCY4_9BACT|nr:outer membrane protein transport protein [Anaeromyxobacter paludicola]BDG09729.1 membrane protein [Anaeromyxobacter paludicola]